MAFATELICKRKTFIVIDDGSPVSSSKMAAGLFNPFVLRRFTPVWNAKQQMDLLLPFWMRVERITKNKYIQHLNIYRIFDSVKEQNSWSAICDTPCGRGVSQ